MSDLSTAITLLGYKPTTDRINPTLLFISNTITSNYRIEIKGNVGLADDLQEYMNPTNLYSGGPSSSIKLCLAPYVPPPVYQMYTENGNNIITEDGNEIILE